MLDAVFTIVVESVFGYVLEHMGLAEKARDWLGRNPAKLAFQKALASAYRAFARQYPEWAESFFDRAFLADRAAPILAQLLTRTGQPDPAALLNAWHASLTPLPLHAARREEMLRASSDFLRWLEAELMQADALQALFDSRALDALNQRVESLTEELRRVLAVTTAQAQLQPLAGRPTAEPPTGAVGRDRVIQRAVLTGDLACLQDLYIPPDDVYERVQVQAFTGRAWLKSRVDAFLADPRRTSGVLVIEGEAGVGKTAFLARLVYEQGYLHVFAGQERARGNINVASAILSLEAQLVTRYRLTEYVDRDTISDRHANPTSLGLFLRQAAAQCAAGEQVVVVCDALDEAGTYPQGNVLGLPEVLPEGVFLIVSRRPSPPVRLHFANLTPVVEQLHAASDDNQEDLAAFLRGVAQRPVVREQLRAQDYTSEQFVRALQSRSGGVWMYVHHILDEILRGERAPLRLDRLPAGLIGYYADYWERERADAATWYDVSLPLLTTLAAVQTPLTFARWAAWAGVAGNPNRLRRDVDDRWRAFISRRGDSYQIYHASLRDFLTGNVERLGQSSDLIAEMAAATQEAHRRIVADLRRQCAGDWPRLVDDDYARRYLCEHLAGAGEIDTLWSLTTESAAWAEARQRKEESYAGFLSDLRRAWEAAESEPHGDLARELRCALVNSSLVALANNLTPELARALVDSGAWSMSKVLAHLSYMTDDRRRAESLAALAPVLVDPWWSDALRIANGIGDPEWRTRTRVALATYSPELWREEALADLVPTQGDVRNDWKQSELITRLGPVLPATLHGQAVGAAGELIFNLSRVQALVGLIPHLAEAPRARALAQALEEAARIGIPVRRVQALMELAPHLSAEPRQRVLRDVIDIIGREPRPALQADLLVHHGVALAAAWPSPTLDLALAIADPEHKMRALATLLPVLPEADQDRALHTLLTPDHEPVCARAIAVLGPVLSEQGRALALERALALTNPLQRARALISLASRLARAPQREAIAQAFRALDALAEEGVRLTLLLELRPCLTEEERVSAWSLVAAVRRPDLRALGFGNLAGDTRGEPRSGRCRRALSEAQALEDPARRLNVLCAWAPALMADERHALPAVAEPAMQALPMGPARAAAAEALLESYPSALRRRLADVILAHSAASDLAARVRGWIGQLPEAERGRVARLAVQALDDLPDSYRRVKGVVALAPWLDRESASGILGETLNVAVTHGDEAARADLLLDLVPFLTLDQNAVVLDAVSVLADPMLRTRTLVRLARLLTGALQNEAYTRALAAPQELAGVSGRIQALFVIARDGSGPAAQQALALALHTARDINDGAPTVDLLIEIMTRVPASVVTTIGEVALRAALSIHDPSERLAALTRLEPSLPEPLKTAALTASLEIARSFAYRPAVVQAIVALLPRLPGPLREPAVDDVLTQIRGLGDARWRAGQVLEVRPYLTPAQWTRQQVEMLEDLGRAQRAADQANILARWAPWASADIGRVLLAFVPDLVTAEDQVQVWMALHPALASEDWDRCQPQVLAALSEIPAWADLTQILVDVGPLLDVSLRPALVPLALKGPDPKSQAQGLLGLYPLLRESDRADVQRALEDVAARAGDTVPWAELMEQRAETWPEAGQPWLLTFAERLEDRATQIAVLLAILPGLAGDRAADTRRVLRSSLALLDDGDDRLESWRHFAPLAEEGERDAVIEEAVRLARTQASDWQLAHTLESLAPLMSSAARVEAAQALRDLDDVAIGLDAWGMVLPLLDEPTRRMFAVDILQRTPEVSGTWRQAKVLAILAPYLPPSSLARAVELADSFDDETRCIALLHLGWARPEGPSSTLLDQALRLPLETPEPLTFVWTLIDALRYSEGLPFVLREAGWEAARIAETHAPTEEREAVMQVLRTRLASAWSAADWERALRAARTGGAMDPEPSIDQKLASIMPAHPVVRAHWRERLQAYAAQHRGRCLTDVADLLPWLVTAGGESVAAELARAVGDVRAWWP